MDFPGGTSGKKKKTKTPANAKDLRDRCSVTESGRSPREGNGNPLQYPCLENPMNRGASGASVHVVAKSWIQLKQVSKKKRKERKKDRKKLNTALSFQNNDIPKGYPPEPGNRT